MTLAELINNGLLTNVVTITLNDEIFSRSYHVNEEAKCLDIHADDGEEYYFPLDSEIEICGFDVIAADYKKDSYTLSFEESRTLDPSKFTNAPNP